LTKFFHLTYTASHHLGFTAEGNNSTSSMKKKSTSQSAFFNLRVLIAALFCLAGIAVAVFGTGAFSSAFAQRNNNSTQNQASPGTQTPDVVRMVGPVRLDQDLRKLPYIAPKPEFEERVLTRYPHGTEQAAAPAGSGTSGLKYVQALLKNMWRPATMPPPLLTFEGGAAAQFCACAPPDSDGDVGPNHYIEAINVAFDIYNKTGTSLAGPITYNTLFAPLTGTPCSGQNDGDPFVFYDQAADRWVISDFAFPSFPGSSFWQCIAVSQTSDPVSGGWHLYALQVDPANPTYLGDYPKFGLWNNPQPGGAYFVTMNEFASPTSFNGVRAYALDRASMIGGGPANAIGFSIPIAGLGDSYSLVAASFRTGAPPPAGRDEFLLAVDSPASNPTTLTQVKGWLFHVDFVTPANSTLGLTSNHLPNALITVNPFVEAWTNTAGFSLVPQQGTTSLIQTLGDKIMTPVVYQNRAGVESLWADQTNILNFPSGPTIIRWYQFNVTGGTFPATAAQQQDWSNANDGLWRFMPSIAVDQNGNTAIGYALSSPSMFPGIRYAGRLAADPPNNLGQGENTLFTGTGSQTGTNGRWGDYSMTTIDPADGLSFWSVGEYYATTSSFNWHTRVGKFNFAGGGVSPTPTPTATPGCTWSAGPDLPSGPGVRLVGVYFPANGKFYAMGGRASDAAGSEFTHPFEYDPVGNAWTTKGATYPDTHTNNMACGVLTDAGTPYIYCVGGSQVTVVGTFDRVFRYNPVTDSLTTVASPWPGAMGMVLPGGFTVLSNKLYILGGFDTVTGGGQGTNQIYEFTPSPAAWVLKPTVLTVPLGYIPTTTIGSLIYTGGGSDITAGVLTDTTNSFVYNPVANTIGPIAPIPRATGETRALNFNGKMLVMGGGRTAPNPSNEVDAYTPGTNTWAVNAPVPAFTNARRNFPTDTNGTDHIWLAGGYDSTGLPTASMEIFNCPQGSPTPTPTATPTATATATPTATATATATATPTPTSTPSPRPTPTPRPAPTPRPRPTP
jgi:N-acetylneuraminic acid mutarotase